MYSRITEIRHLSSADVYKLSQILEPMQFWKKLMRIIPKFISEDKPKEFKYNTDHIRLIECAYMKDGRTCTEILIDEWGCSGRKRPTVGILLDLLIEAELFRAADFVALNFLNEPPPERPLKGPAAKVDISIPLESREIKEIENMLNDVSYPGTNTLIDNAHVRSNINNQDYYEKLGQREKKLGVIQSDLLQFSSESDNIPNLTDLVQTDTTYIPAISALTGPNSESILPNLSALHIEDDKKEITEIASEDSVGGYSSTSSASQMSMNDSSLHPNLSIFEESHLNESSLTNVTETSEENVLFTSNENVSENIPCLSALNNHD